MSNEIWKAILNTNGAYEISNYGRLRSYLGQGAKKASKEPAILKISINGSGYPAKYIRGVNLRIHRLVAEAFIPNPAGLPMVNHIDGNKQNNHFSNLEWCDKSHNEQHAERMGLKNKARGEGCNKSTLSNIDVMDIFKSTSGARELGRLYGVNHSTISNIKTGRTWNHVTGAPIVPNKRNVSHK
jgi:hypothetical protein